MDARMPTNIGRNAGLRPTTFLMPDFSFCTDNAAMIAVAAYFRSLTKKKFDVAKISANGNLKLQ